MTTTAPSLLWYEHPDPAYRFIGHHCPHKLVRGGRCWYGADAIGTCLRAGYAHGNREPVRFYRTHEPDYEALDLAHWFDHCAMFQHRETGARILTAQPYTVSGQQRGTLARFCDRHNFGYSWSLNGGWWTSCDLIVLRAPSS
jgi:hypothetical protein